MEEGTHNPERIREFIEKAEALAQTYRDQFQHSPLLLMETRKGQLVLSVSVANARALLDVISLLARALATLITQRRDEIEAEVGPEELENHRTLSGMHHAMQIMKLMIMWAGQERRIQDMTAESEIELQAKIREIFEATKRGDLH